MLGRQNRLGKFKVVTGDHSKHGPEDDVECGRSAAHKGGEKAASVCVRVIADHVICHWHTTHDLPNIKKNSHSPSRFNTNTHTHFPRTLKMNIVRITA